MSIPKCKFHAADNVFFDVPLRLNKFSIGVFFDGTANNSGNACTNLKYPSINKGRSYKGYYTNIHWLRNLYSQSWIYVKGAGTDWNLGKDDTAGGSAMGKGETGVVKHIEYACKTIAEKLSEKGLKNLVIPLDVFGFSRGAATARNFVYHLDKEKKYKEIKGEDHGYLGKYLEDNNIEFRIRFLGIFDTVLSRGVYPFEESDVEDFPLNVKNAEYVFHITAMDEYRENFSLTRIGTDVDGMEIALPGVHSDIGGGYRDNISNEGAEIYELFDTVHPVFLNLGSVKEKLKAKLTQRGKSLIRAGWFDKIVEKNQKWNSESSLNALRINSIHTPFPVIGMNLTGYRKKISNKYSLIPLSIMHDEALKHGVPLNPLTKQLKVPNKLKQAERRLFQHKRGNSLNPSNPKDYQLLKFLRANYLHMSAQYNDIGHDPAENHTREVFTQQE